MISLARAWQLLNDAAAPLASRTVPPNAACGCRLAEPVTAEADWPPADVSAMDGFAAKAADLARGAPLPVAFSVSAGVLPPALPAGSAARIFTGAVLPSGADVVVPQEEATIHPDGRVLLRESPAGTYVRRRGEVCRAGQVLAGAGTLVTPALLGVLAALAPRAVDILPRPRVAVLTTGDELLGLDAERTPGCIRDSNGPMLAALARQAGWDVRQTSRVNDEATAIRAALAELVEHTDLIITNGGVSVGARDHVPRVVTDLGGETLFHGVRIKPGKPTLIARVQTAWIVGLPGNPLSAFVGWHLFALPLGRRLAGQRRAFGHGCVKATLTQAARGDAERTLIAPALMTGTDTGCRVELLEWRGSHDLLALARSNAFALLDVGTAYAAGVAVPCIPACADGLVPGQTESASETTHPEAHIHG